jgi:hypothetical protein
VQLPIDYPSSVKARLHHICIGIEMIDAVAVELCKDLWVQTNWNARLSFIGVESVD